MPATLASAFQLREEASLAEEQGNVDRAEVLYVESKEIFLHNGSTHLIDAALNLNAIASMKAKIRIPLGRCAQRRNPLKSSGAISKYAQAAARNEQQAQDFTKFLPCYTPARDYRFLLAGNQMSSIEQPQRFEDHFSKHSQTYAQYRPQYPEEIYAYLASIAPANTLAWDCGTGNGQAALGLAKYFDKVYATDASAEQIAHAYAHPKVGYHVEPAEHISLADSSVDLVTVAVAIHWFNFDQFYSEVRRVLKPNGILAAWTYNLPQISPPIDPLISRYYFDILNGFWPERIRYLEQGYRTLPFPFEEIIPPSFAMQAEWTLDQFAGFLNSWSATQRYKEQNGHHPLEKIWNELSAAWGNKNDQRLIRWPLHFRIGRNS